ncbi:GNAT family N-acetyltransferase [Nereida sp. MMG025]|uniref:GNAT family N-acetyltransferase n=1 Tax=Nereida sp. MMG025 TaxID=2909981 RepID=UPI001F47A410|nr:GNAT family N-acetyltransferase [Nereida sp. MMG025]MCF6444201.1 GNAT family N-acetyltransferase [Nereida sp. MMG025]
MTTAPTLHTARLTLRPHVMADWPAFAGLMASDRARFMGGPYGQDAAWGMFCSDIAQWHLLGHGALAIEYEGNVVGQVAVNHPPHFPEVELGWLAFDGHEGRGFITEAAAALKLWAVRNLGLQTLVSYIDAANLSSIALAKRLGATHDHTARGPHPDDQVYRHMIDDDGGMEAYA